MNQFDVMALIDRADRTTEASGKTTAEIAALVAEIRAMTAAQAEQTASVLRAILAMVDRKIEVNVPEHPAPVVNIDKPKEWKIEGIERDNRTGRIESAKIKVIS